MKVELFDEWLVALRSGEYKQIQGRLHDPDDGGFCCLGVLCEVVGLPMSEEGYYILDKDGKKVSYDPLKELMPNQLVTNCMKWNDGGITFNNIATNLEEERAAIVNF